MNLQDRPESGPGPVPQTTSIPPSDGILDVQIQGLSEKLNRRLTEFFHRSAAHTRLYHLLVSLDRHHSMRTANAVAFDLFLALVPMLGLAGWAVSVFLVSEASEAEAKMLTRFTPGQLEAVIGEHFQALKASHLAPLAALAGWWLASSAFSTLIDVFEEAFECLPRNWIHKRVLSLAFSLLGMVLLSAAGAVGILTTMLVPTGLEPGLHVLSDLGLNTSALALSSFLALTGFFALLYRYSIRRPKKARRVWPGALTATTLGALASVGLGYYAATIARYTLFYGGLAAIVVLLLWLWLWSTALLLGAEINIALEDVAFGRPVQTHLAAVSSSPPPTQTPSSE